MPTEPAAPGWPWTEDVVASASSTDAVEAFRACFGTPCGRIALDHLCRLFLQRRVAPTSSDAELRHVEGQRSVVAWVIAMASPDAIAEPPATTPSARWIGT